MSTRDDCGVCRNQCPHGHHGGDQFCVFCLRAHSDHLDTELKVTEREKLAIVAENEGLRGEKSELRGTLLAIVNNHEPGDELGSGFHQGALDVLKKTDWKRW